MPPGLLISQANARAPRSGLTRTEIVFRRPEASLDFELQSIEARSNFEMQSFTMLRSDAGG